MPGPKVYTHQELKDEYADMILMFADGGEKKLEAHILAKGRTEMHQLLAFLFVRCLELDMQTMNKD